MQSTLFFQICLVFCSLAVPTFGREVSQSVHLGYLDEIKPSNNYTTEKYLKKAFMYIRNSPAFKNYTMEVSKNGAFRYFTIPNSIPDAMPNIEMLKLFQDLADLISELETWEAPQRLVKNFPYYLAGYDAEDRPVWVAEVGKYNLRGEVERGEENIQLCLKYVFQAVHRIIKSMYDKDTPEREIRHAVFLLDLDGFDLFQFGHTETISVCLRLTRDYMEVTDKLMGSCVFVNVNHIAQLAVSLFRPILGRVLERMEFFGTNKAKWIPHVRRVLPENVIPTWYGGNENFKPVQIYG